MSSEKVSANDPRWKVADNEELEIGELLDEFEDNFPSRELENLAKQIEEKVEALPGHGGHAGYYAKDLTQIVTNLGKVLDELERFFG